MTRDQLVWYKGVAGRLEHPARIVAHEVDEAPTVGFVEGKPARLNTDHSRHEFTGQAERIGASVSLLSWQRESSSRVAPVPWPPLQRTIRDLQPVEARLDGLRPQVLNNVLVRGGLVAT